MALDAVALAALPIGTSNAQAFARNAGDIDRVVNGSAAAVDVRTGAQVLSLAEALRRIGLETPVAFVSGLSISRATQTVASGGLTYHANPASLPFTTTGTFSAGQWLLVSNITAQDLASTAVGKGASMIGVQDIANRYAGTTVESALAEVGEWRGTRLNFMDFVPSAAVRASILDGTCTTDLQAYFAAWRAALVADGGERAGYLPAGIYPYSVAQNWAIDRLTVISDGARLRFTGTGPAFICDGVAGTAVTNVAQYNYAVRWLGRTYIEGSAGSGAGILVKSGHHAVFENFNVRSCGTGYPALNVKFAVCTTFPNFTVSGNEGAWFGGSAPATGILLEAFSIGADPGQTSYCTFHNPIIEGVATGAYLTGTLGNNFIGGTIEGCSGFGVISSAGAQQDKFIGVDLELNTLGDFLINGWGHVIDHCDTLTKISIQSGFDNQILGGRHVAIECLSASHHNRFDHCEYDRRTTGAVLSDLGTYNSFAGCKRPSSPYRGRPLAIFPVTPTGSGMVIANITGDPQYVTISGGTGVSVYHGRFGTSFISPVSSGQEITLNSGDDIAITYTTAPTITMFK